MDFSLKFLVDECTGPKVAKWLEAEGYEVFSVFDDARGISDLEIIKKAEAEDWIIITNDKDFGELIFRDSRGPVGVILLRLSDERATNKIHCLNTLLTQLDTVGSDQFIVVTEENIRISKQR